MAQLVFETHDLDEAAAIMQQQYGAATVKAPGRDPGLRVRQGSLAGVLLGDIEYFMDATFIVEDLDVTYVARPLKGTMATRIGRQDSRWGSDDVYLLDGAGTRLECDVHDAHVEFAAIDRATFKAVASAADGMPAALTGANPVSAAAARRWTSALDFARRVAAEPEVPGLVAGATARLVAATALATFPNDAQTEPTIQDRRDSHPQTVRRAVAFIESHLDHDFTVRDVADACYVTPRALQLAFRRHLGTTPMAFARRTRLDQARRDLQAAAPDGPLNVTTIAGRWGFSGLSRFSQQYRQTFGELPRDTLRR